MRALVMTVALYALLAAISDAELDRPLARETMRAATTGGAATAHLHKEIGAIRPGMRADLAILDLRDPAFVPFNSAARQLVYGEGGRGVETVIVDGRIVMRDRKLLTLDEAALRAELDAVVPGFRRDAEAVMARTARLRPHIAAADRRIWEQDLGLARYVGH